MPPVRPPLPTPWNVPFQFSRQPHFDAILLADGERHAAERHLRRARARKHGGGRPREHRRRQLPFGVRRHVLCERDLARPQSSGSSATRTTPAAHALLSSAAASSTSTAVDAIFMQSPLSFDQTDASMTAHRPSSRTARTARSMAGTTSSTRRMRLRMRATRRRRDACVVRRRLEAHARCHRRWLASPSGCTAIAE